MNAIRVARELEPLRPYWFEEPCPPDNIPSIKEVKEATTIPVVTGEALYTRNEFREVCETRAADIIKSGYLQHWRDLGVDSDSGHGGTVLHRGIAARLELDVGGLCGGGAGFCWDA